MPPDDGVPTQSTEGSYPSSFPLVSNLNVVWSKRMLGQQFEGRSKQEVQTTTISRALTRWRILLPTVMSVLSAFLLALEARQQPMLRGMGTGWEVPAKVINSLINGPGFYLGGLIPLVLAGLNQSLKYEAGRLLGIAFFWFLVGFSIDRRTNGQALDLRHPIRAGILFTFATLVCAFFGAGLGIVTFRDPIFWRVLTEYPLRTENTMKLGLVVWLLVFCRYFAKRAFIASRRSLVT
jgi:hypothetical protein